VAKSLKVKAKMINAGDTVFGMLPGNVLYRKGRNPFVRLTTKSPPVIISVSWNAWHYAYIGMMEIGNPREGIRCCFRLLQGPLDCNRADCKIGGAKVME